MIIRVLTLEDIEKLLPHREPMLLINRAVISRENGDTDIEAEYFIDPKTVFVKGHFPGFAVLPGVMILEALAQAGAILFFCLNPSYVGRRFFLASADNVKWRNPIIPDRVLVLRSRITHTTGGRAVRFSCSAITRDGNEDNPPEIRVAEAEIMGMIG